MKRGDFDRMEALFRKSDAPGDWHLTSTRYFAPKEWEAMSDDVRSAALDKGVVILRSPENKFKPRVGSEKSLQDSLQDWFDERLRASTRSPKEHLAALRMLGVDIDANVQVQSAWLLALAAFY
jgi:hypothetical protein